MSRWVHLFPWITLVWNLHIYATATSGTITRNWCYSKEILPQELSCRDGYVLAIVEATPRVHTQNHPRFCLQPGLSRSDCILTSTTQTDHYRRMCNGLTDCVFMLSRRPKNTCLVAPDGPMYLQIEYICTQALDKKEENYPVIRPLLSGRGESEEGLIWLQSSDYPSKWGNISQTRCSVHSDGDATLTVSILDLSVYTNPVYTTQEEQACLYYFSVGNDTKVCAKPGLQGPVLHVAPVQDADGRAVTDMAFIVPEMQLYTVRGRFWIQIAGYRQNGITAAPIQISCSNPLSPYVQPSTHDDGRSVAWIVVPVILVLLVILIIIIIIAILIWRMRKKKARNAEADKVTDAEAVEETYAKADEDTDTKAKGKLNKFFPGIFKRKARNAEADEVTDAEADEDTDAEADQNTDAKADQNTDAKGKGKLNKLFPGIFKRKARNAEIDEDKDAEVDEDTDAEADEDTDAKAKGKLNKFFQSPFKRKARNTEADEDTDAEGDGKQKKFFQSPFKRKARNAEADEDTDEDADGKNNKFFQSPFKRKARNNSDTDAEADGKLNKFFQGIFKRKAQNASDIDAEANVKLNPPNQNGEAGNPEEEKLNKEDPKDTDSEGGEDENLNKPEHLSRSTAV